jgi:hypothetical protein
MSAERFNTQQPWRRRARATATALRPRRNVSAAGSPERRSTVRRSGHATLAVTPIPTNVTAERLKATHAPAHLRA